ncbi:MAG TPA: hypothetical protein PKD85_17225, partial [Saprospiraceae bacterium]|nr:hypothetical protein [Saprospiraceae bacterium]
MKLYKTIHFAVFTLILPLISFSQEALRLQQAYQYLTQNITHLNIETNDIPNFVVNHTYTDDRTKATYIYPDQTYEG